MDKNANVPTLKILRAIIKKLMHHSFIIFMTIGIKTNKQKLIKENIFCSFSFTEGSSTSTTFTAQFVTRILLL
jgi:hypothetical protein